MTSVAIGANSRDELFWTYRTGVIVLTPPPPALGVFREASITGQIGACDTSGLVVSPVFFFLFRSVPLVYTVAGEGGPNSGVP